MIALIHYSNRIAASVEPTPWSLSVEAAREAGEIRFDLTESNPTRAGLVPSPEDAAAICQALGDPRALAYEPHPKGMPSARRAIAAHYEREHGIEVDPERLWLAASTSELYAQLFMLHCDPGDEVLVAQPSYPLIESIAALTGTRVAHYSLRDYAGAFRHDRAAIEAAITDRTRVLVCVAPNNPTGNALTDEELEAITELCSERSIALIVDEVFAEYALDGARDDARGTTTVVDERCLCWTLAGLSKTAALPQMKLAWAALSGPERVVASAELRFEHVADTFLSASAPVQCAADVLLERTAPVRSSILERLRANLATARRVLSPETGASVLRCEGGWSATLALPAVLTDEAWAERLLRQGVLVQPGFFFDFEQEARVVVSLITEPAVFQRGIEQIAAACREELEE